VVGLVTLVCIANFMKRLERNKKLFITDEEVERPENDADAAEPRSAFVILLTILYNKLRPRYTE